MKSMESEEEGTVHLILILHSDAILVPNRVYRTSARRQDNQRGRHAAKPRNNFEVFQIYILFVNGQNEEDRLIFKMTVILKLLNGLTSSTNSIFILIISACIPNFW